jgi:hypothetical protein
MIEQSTTKLPDFGRTRGQVIFRYNHQQIERQNEEGETETIWQCTHERLDPKTVGATPGEPEHREMIMARLTTEVNAYINAHYDQGSQASFQALYSLAATPQAVKDAIFPLWPWIQSVMTYYYEKKSDIRDGQEYANVAWDFSQFDATDPDIDLENYMGPQI